MVRAMVHSVKHYVQVTLTSALTGATAFVAVADALNRPSVNLASEVNEGSSIKAVYMEIWAIGTTADQFFTAILAKLPGGVSNIANSQMVNLFAYDNKKNVLYTTQGLASNDGIAAPIPIYKGWIKIPKSKQRFGLRDKLQFALASRGDATIKFCGFFLYKEYT